jgi:glycosyltransferase involved in cell wall biosynthesis
MRKLVIGYTNPRNYNLDKILCTNPPKEVDLKFVLSPSSVILIRLAGKKGGVYPKILLPLSRVSLIHSFWAPILNKMPWIISFSSSLPYFSEEESPFLYRLSVNALKSKYCKKLLPTSKNALLILKDKPFFDNSLKEKIEIVNYAYPDIYKHKYKKDKKNGKLNILFLGHLFFLKGGDIFLEVFNSIKNHFNVELTVISRIKADNWLTKTTKNNEETAKKSLINSSQVTWIKEASYKEVTERFFPNADIFVLPSWSETWGHVICEALSAGLPVISTRIRAIPEIIQHNANGFLIDLPVDKHGVLYTSKLSRKEPDYFKVAREEYRGKMKEKLKYYLIKLLQDKDTRVKFGRKSRKLFEEKFTYEVRNKKLIGIYKNALIK